MGEWKYRATHHSIEIVNNFTSRPLYSPRKEPPYPLVKKLGRLQVSEEKIPSLPLHELNPDRMGI